MAKLMLALGLVLLCPLAAARAQAQALPSMDVLRDAMRQAQAQASRDMDDAARRSQGTTGTAPAPRPSLPDVRKIGAAASQGVDPGRLAERYQALSEPGGEAPPELIVFVSLSMPEESLRRLGEQARRAGAVLVFRGLKFGIQHGGWTASMAALKPLAQTGATLQIQPALFSRYQVSVVPTVLVDAAPKAGCQVDACASQAAWVTGDVSLDYALERLAARPGAMGALAQSHLDRLRHAERR